MLINQMFFNILKDSFSLYCRSFRAVLPIITLYFLMVFLVHLMEQMWLLPWVPIVAQVILLLVAALAFPAMLYRQWEWQSKTLKRRCYRRVFALSVKRAPYNIAASIAVVLIMVAPSALYHWLTPAGRFYHPLVYELLLVAGLLLAVNWVLAPALIMLEDKGLFAALAGSLQLMKKHWMRTVISFVVCCVISWLILKLAYYIFPPLLLLLGNGLAYVAHVDAVRFAISATVVLFQLVPILLAALPTAFILINYQALARAN